VNDIREKCSCGASFKANGDEALKLYRAWVKRHVCPDTPPEIQRDYESTSTIGFAADFTGTGMDIPARKSDPFDDDDE
jgi:hypothetical protein